MKNKSSASKESLLSTEKPSKAIVQLAIPAALALLAKAVYNIVDTAYIGMLRDDNVLAAVGVTLPLLLIMVSIENIFAAGAGAGYRLPACHRGDERPGEGGGAVVLGDGQCGIRPALLFRQKRHAL